MELESVHAGQVVQEEPETKTDKSCFHYLCMEVRASAALKYKDTSCFCAYFNPVSPLPKPVLQKLQKSVI